MALFPNPKTPVLYDGAIGKTHTNLVVSEGRAPAERYMVAKDNGSDPFIYEYGPEGNQTVLIAKGKIVEAAGTEKDRENGGTATAIKVAAENSNRVLGVNHHNVYDQRRDGMEGNRPVIITRSYIEVPLFETTDEAVAASTAKAIHFGAAYGVSDALQPGDYVVAGIDGNFKKFDPAAVDADFSQVVGQVHRVNRELPPQGLLQYFTGLKTSQLDEYIKQISATPAPTEGGYPYGSPYSLGSWKADFLTAIAGGNLDGIPFLTDGYFSSLERIQAVIGGTENVESSMVGEGATLAGTTVTVDAEADDAMAMVKLAHKIAQREMDSIKVTYNLPSPDGGTTPGEEVVVAKRDVHIDLENNTVVVYLDGGVVAENITVEVEASVNPVAGIPTEWDYKGSVGAARIQLMK